MVSHQTQGTMPPAGGDRALGLRLEPARRQDRRPGRCATRAIRYFMRSLFDDHMSDLAERGLRPDRRYEELAVRVEIPDEILRRLSQRRLTGSEASRP